MKIFPHNILDVLTYRLMDFKESVKCIKFLLHSYKYINIIMFITITYQSKYFRDIIQMVDSWITRVVYLSFSQLNYKIGSWIINVISVRILMKQVILKSSPLLVPAARTLRPTTINISKDLLKLNYTFETPYLLNYYPITSITEDVIIQRGNWKFVKRPAITLGEQRKANGYYTWNFMYK